MPMIVPPVSSTDTSTPWYDKTITGAPAVCSSPLDCLSSLWNGITNTANNVFYGRQAPPPPPTPRTPDQVGGSLTVPPANEEDAQATVNAITAQNIQDIQNQSIQFFQNQPDVAGVGSGIQTAVQNAQNSIQNSIDGLLSTGVFWPLFIGIAAITVLDIGLGVFGRKGRR